MITVIIPVYNVERYIRQCLSSIFNQSYKDIEVIIVNDGSTDNSLNIIREYERSYHNILYLEQKNKGVSEARNLALRHAKGNYILFIDSDDYLEEDSLQLLYNKLRETDADILISGHNEIYDDNIKGNDTSVYLSADENRVYSGREVGDMMLNCNLLGVLWNKIFKRELLIKENFNFEAGRYIQDWYPVFKQVCSSENVRFINRPTYNYRQRGSSTVNSKNQKLLDDYCHAVNNMLNYAILQNFSKKSILKFKVITFSHIIKSYYDLNKGKGFMTYKEFKKTKYNSYRVTLKELNTIKDISIREKLNIFIWNIGLYHVVNKLEKLLQGGVA